MAWAEKLKLLKRSDKVTRCFSRVLQLPYVVVLSVVHICKDPLLHHF